jgi:hypothetical protein
MSFSCYCIATCDLREDRPNSSDFDLLSTDLVNRGSGGEIVRVEGRFRVASGYYQLDLTLQTSLGERKYKADSSMADPDQTGALLWVRGGRIEAISINDTSRASLKIMVDKTVRCPRELTLRVYNGIRLTIMGRISEAQDPPTGMTLESPLSSEPLDDCVDSDLPGDPSVDELVGEEYQP